MARWDRAVEVGIEHVAQNFFRRAIQFREGGAI